MNRSKNDRRPEQYKTIPVRADEYKKLCEDYAKALVEIARLKANGK